MNIDKIKEFISIRAELKTAGVIGLSVHDNVIHVRPEKLVDVANLQMVERDCEKYPFEVFTTIDEIKLYAIVEDLEKFPRLAGYMEEDINFEGDENIA